MYREAAQVRETSLEKGAKSNTVNNWGGSQPLQHAVRGISTRVKKLPQSHLIEILNLQTITPTAAFMTLACPS